MPIDSPSYRVLEATLDRLDGLVFDAVGTLIVPADDVARVYADVGRRFGICDAPEIIWERFRQAFLREEAIDEQAGWHVDESREFQRWRSIVQGALPGSSDDCFQSLFDHYAQPDAWQVVPGAAEVLESLQQRGLRLGMASNFDARLEAITARLPGLQAVARRLVISSRVGVRKPDPRFFAHVATCLGVAPARLGYLGDDLRNDFMGSQQAGFSSILYDPKNRYPGIKPRICHFAELFI